MPGQWYYGRGADIAGPVSDRELSDLAASDDLLPTDTVWREGVEAGVPAGKVKNLFRFAPHPPARPSPDPVTPAPDVAVSEESTAANEPTAKLPVASPGPEARAEVIPTGPAPEAEIPPTPGWSTKPPNPKTARAVPGKGVVIIGQDGATVKFRMKCTTCGREDT